MPSSRFMQGLEGLPTHSHFWLQISPPHASVILTQVGNSGFLLLFPNSLLSGRKKLTNSFAWLADFTKDLGVQNNFGSTEVII